MAISILLLMSLILITFSLDLCINTVWRSLMLVTLGALRVKEDVPLDKLDRVWFSGCSFLSTSVWVLTLHGLVNIYNFSSTLRRIIIVLV